MPRLLKFRAENCFFDAPLVEFLRYHASTLETIHLVNCMAAVSLFHQLEEPNPTWKGLFEGILGAEPHNLKDLRVTTRKISIHDIAKWAQQRSLAEQEIIRRIEQKLSEDETYPLFYYGWLDPDYGFVSVAWTFVLESFETGSDLATLERLMGVVRRNREASRLTLQKEHD
ncbi:hypothetical protein DFJ73DRAFT_66989 [Zopfochytrium polystomum]|nr:hypothetical protein DFJ73DRAFT_66989 [Zopfochytrium polystomum]